MCTQDHVATPTMRQELYTCKHKKINFEEFVQKIWFANNFKAIIGTICKFGTQIYLYNTAICSPDFKEIEHSFSEIHEPHSQQS